MKPKKEKVVTGAIRKALQLKNKDEQDKMLVEKVRTDLLAYGVRENYYLNDLEIPQKFLARVESNGELLSALLRARKLEIPVHLKTMFEVNVGTVSIDVNATDEEIIRFLTK